MFNNDNYLFISDTQIPFEHENALKFCKYLERHYKIPKENIYHVGDEVDNLHGSMYPKDPDGIHSPSSEIGAAKEKLKEWIAAFPHLKIATSNHGLRWAKKASAAEIPSQLMRAYQDVLGIPDTWRYQEKWIIEGSRKKMLMSHGVDLSGKTPYRTAAELSSISRIFGHLHSVPGICYVETMDKSIWSMCVGSLIDKESYAFKYDKANKFQPVLGCGVVCAGGAMPIWIPL